MSRLMAVLSMLLSPLAVFAQKKPDLEKLLEARTYGEGKSALLYRIMKPEDYDSKKSYPLVVFLHGAGKRGNDNKAQMVHGIADFAKKEARKKHPCFLVVPQCPTDRRWVEVDWTTKTHTMPSEPSEPARQVLDLIESLCKEFSIDKKRIYLTGLSMGGFGTWDLLCRRPDLFAAAVPVCGGADEKQAAKLVKIPIWAFHGDKDTTVVVERSRNMIAAIKKAGGDPKYTEYPGVGHDSWTQTYRNPKVLDWLFEQRKK